MRLLNVLSLFFAVWYFINQRVTERHSGATFTECWFCHYPLLLVDMDSVREGEDYWMWQDPPKVPYISIQKAACLGKKKQTSQTKPKTQASKQTHNNNRNGNKKQQQQTVQCQCNKARMYDSGMPLDAQLQNTGNRIIVIFIRSGTFCVAGFK